MDLQFHQLLIVPDSIEIRPLNLTDIATDETYEEEEEHVEETTPKKRVRNESEWVRVKRKIARQAGKEYVNSRNVLVKAKKFKYKICEKCPFKCTTKITYEAAKSIHDEFWKLNDNLKSRFYEKTTFKEFKKRERKRIPSNESRRTYSFLYYFHVGKEKIRVCRDFYVKTLNISARRVARFHEKVFEGIALPHMDGRGRSTKNKIPEEVRDRCKDHINSFPYEQLLECKNLVKTPTALNVVKMYELYCQKCKEDNIEPSKLWLYRKIFQDEMYYRENPDAMIPQDFCHYVEDEDEEQDKDSLIPEMLNVEIKEDSKIIETKQFEYKICNSKCTFNCNTNFDYNAAKQIYGDFWKLSSYDKNLFYNSSTVRELTGRKSKTGRTKYLFEFYFYLNGVKTRVCKDFYLTTLCISLARIVYFYKIKLARVKTKEMVDEYETNGSRTIGDFDDSGEPTNLINIVEYSPTNDTNLEDYDDTDEQNLMNIDEFLPTTEERTIDGFSDTEEPASLINIVEFSHETKDIAIEDFDDVEATKNIVDFIPENLEGYVNSEETCDTVDYLPIECKDVD